MKRRKVIGNTALAVSLMCITAGCDPIGIEIGLEEKVRDLMEETVDKLTEQSSLWQDESQQWRQELEDLQDNLARAIRDAENDASYAEQHVINDANNLLDEVKVLAESSIHSVGASVGCTTSIVVDQVKDSLVGLLASFTGMSGPEADPQLCAITPDSVEYKKILEGNLVKLEVFGFDFVNPSTDGQISLTLVGQDGSTVDVTSALTRSSPYKMTINLNNIDITETSDALSITVGDEEYRAAVIPLPVCDVRTVELHLEDTLYVPPHREGDTEFGHQGFRFGPFVRVTARLFQDGFGENKTRLMANINMRAEGTKARIKVGPHTYLGNEVEDPTLAYGDDVFQLWQADPGYKISRIITHPTETAEVTFRAYSAFEEVSDGVWEIEGSDYDPMSRFVFGDGANSPVETFAIYGFDDDGVDAGDFTSTRVTWNPIEVEVRQYVNCHWDEGEEDSCDSFDPNTILDCYPDVEPVPGPNPFPF